MGARVIVCICFNISDRLVRDRAREGRSLHELLEETGAGSACGACRLAVARVHAGEKVEAASCAASGRCVRTAA
jgi:bacterioferritin-associated ferredoxin